MQKKLKTEEIGTYLQDKKTKFKSIKSFFLDKQLKNNNNLIKLHQSHIKYLNTKQQPKNPRTV